MYSNMTIIFALIALAVAITVHEAAHAWMADRLGDPTPRLMGRLSLNPIVHYDSVGTTLLLITVLLAYRGIVPFPFGWAKPVPFDPYNLANPKRDSALISLAGPVSNLLIASIASILLRISFGPFSYLNFLSSALYPLIVLNVALAIFNLIPIHPLDGGKVLVGILPSKYSGSIDAFLTRYGILILFFLIFPFGGASFLGMIISPVISFFLNLFIPGYSMI